MTHRLRFVPLLLILAGLAVGLAVHPAESSAQDTGAAAAEGAALRGDARTARRADAALRISRRARKIARRVSGQVGAAVAAAEEAQSAVAVLTERLDAGIVASDSEAGSVTTDVEADYVDLGGPSVTVDVPRSGLVEIWASVRFEDPSDGQVALYEDGQRVPIPGQDGVCDPGGTQLGDVLLSAAFGPGLGVTLSTPTALIFGFGCGTAGAAPGPMLFERAPGRHTYELRYADCGCDAGDATFSQRTLRAAGRE